MRIEEGADFMMLTLTKIKIKDSRDWENSGTRRFEQNEWANTRIPTMLDRLSDTDYNTIILNTRVTVTFHMIKYFEKLYQIWGIDNFQNFYQSLSPKFNRNMIFKAGEGAGRSGSFFFFSHDRKFVVKTMTTTELNLVKRMMPAYTKHLENNPDSLLCKILGIFTVNAELFRNVQNIRYRRYFF